MGHYYLQYPSLQGRDIFFLANNTLWRGTLGDPRVIPLHHSRAGLKGPRVSPDGKWLAFASAEEGPTEIYVLSLETGNSRRLTYHPEPKTVAGWSKDSRSIYFSSSMESEVRNDNLFAVPVEGGAPRYLNLGILSHIHFNPDGEDFVTAKGVMDPASWKGYRGGRTGKVFYCPQPGGEFRLLTTDAAGQSLPHLAGERIYFLSDRDGVANLYSYDREGRGLTQHTHFKDFFVRWPHVQGGRAVLQHGGDLWILDLLTGKLDKLEFFIPGYGPQKSFYFSPLEPFIHGLDLSPNGKKMALNARGKLFLVPNWEGTPRQFGEKQGVRYRLSQFLDETRMVTVSDETEEETLELFTLDGETKTRLAGPIDGRVNNMTSSNDGKQLLYSVDNRLYLMEVKNKKKKLIAKSEYGPISSYSISPDGHYVTYCFPEKDNRHIYLYDVKRNRSENISGTEWDDMAPQFDTEGRFIYFLSCRYLDPYRDQMDLDYGFPNTIKPYLIVLNQDTPSPFTRAGQSFLKETAKEATNGKGDSTEDKKNKKKKKSKRPPIKIDWEGMAERIFEFPVPAKPYKDIFQRGNRVFFVSSPLVGLRGYPDIFDLSTKGDKTLEYFDLASGEWHLFARDIMGVDDSVKSDLILIKKVNGLRVVNCLTNADEKSIDKSTATLLGGRAQFSESSGWVNLERVKLNIDPRLEWRQIFIEAWRMARDFYWRADMDGVDWDKVKKRFLPLIPRLANRFDLQDLLWELYGELRTSHAYVMGGALPWDAYYPIGLLGADYRFSAKGKGYEIARVFLGDTFQEDNYSPLGLPGVNLKPGDIITAIDGDPLTERIQPNQLLVEKVRQEVALTVRRKGSRSTERIEVRTLASDKGARYRDWVAGNRRRVERETKGEMGYIHLPNMQLAGITEFTRTFHAQAERKGLILDARNNGGGHVSQIIIAKLRKHLIGMSVARWYGSQTDPYHHFNGPMVVLCNENTGSDGDIFCVSFQELKMGPVIGVRTWGGVIGIMPRMKCVDNTVLTQPEFATWFFKQGFRVENHGADPDIEVENFPQDYASGRDRQLERGIAELKKLSKNWNYASTERPPLDPPLHRSQGRKG